MSAIATEPTVENLAETGWRTEFLTDEQGKTTVHQIPLTDAEFLHPQEGYHLPSSTFHETAQNDLKDMLQRRYCDRPDVGIFSDLILKWDIAGLKDHCPDVYVVFDMANKEMNRNEFVVAIEGTRPALIVEVVSPRYRRIDREDKVKEYARAGVQEYIILDRRQQRGQWVEEALGYRLLEGIFVPITPDENGMVLSEVTGVLMGLAESRVTMIDALSGERLLTALELSHRVEEEQRRAEQERQRAEQEHQRAERLAEQLRQLGVNPEL